MGSQEISQEERLKRFLYTRNYNGAYITGDPDNHISKYTSTPLFSYIKSAPEDFFKILSKANEDPLFPKRSNLFFILSEALHSTLIPNEIKTDIKLAVFKFIKSDEEFFDFVKYYTLTLRKSKRKITTTLRKMIIKFYNEKDPMELAKCVTKHEKYHGWSHKDLIKLCHFKCENVLCEPVLKYVLFGVEKIGNESSNLTDFLKKNHELRTTEDVSKAVFLITELHASVDQINSKLNKNEEVWLAALQEMTPRQVLQCLYRFYKFGFIKAGSQFQAKIIEILSDAEKVKKCNLHPIEVFIYLKFFEKGGKTMHPKLIEYLHKKEIREETLKKLTTPNEPKCKPVIQNINKCLKLSYDNVEPTGKKIMVTIDVTEKIEDVCFHNKRISFLEAAVAIVRFLCKVEKNVTVAVFKDSQINIVDIGKTHSAVEKLQEHKSAYILPSAPIEFAKNKKKQIDVFINFMSCDWLAAVPSEIKEKMEKLSDVLTKYSKKMKTTDTKVVKFFLGGTSNAFTENGKNILAISGFSVEVPRILEAFCRGNFC